MILFADCSLLHISFYFSYFFCHFRNNIRENVSKLSNIVKHLGKMWQNVGKHYQTFVKWHHAIIILDLERCTNAYVLWIISKKYCKRTIHLQNNRLRYNEERAWSLSTFVSCLFVSPKVANTIGNGTLTPCSWSKLPMCVATNELELNQPRVSPPLKVQILIAEKSREEHPICL